MFTLIHGNRQEALARHMAEVVSDKPLPLFQREVVVVQSGGMARWLQMFLAEELGLACQYRFTFPAGYLWELFGTVLTDVPKDSPFSSDILIWQLLRLVEEAPDAETFAPLHRYLADGDVLKRHGLAQRLAECFDGYLSYRPEWVATWLQGKTLGLGEHEAWQAWLWQRIGAEAGNLPDAHPAELFFRALDAQPELIAKLPKRITVFGVGAMPPPYLDIFKRLGQYIDVAFYVVNPCREYWGDLVTKRALARAALETPDALPLLEVGHPLLGSLGQVTRHFFDHLAGEHDVDLFVEPQASSAESPLGGRRFSEGLLSLLHADVLEMRSRTPDEREVLADADQSIQFHVCHSTTREIEVLHDRLLALFAADPTLQPNDVLVLVPDLPSFAPLVEAVFASTSGKQIPFTIADRPLELEAPLLRAFNAVLDLSGSRFDAERVLEVLEQPCIAARFGFDDEALDMARAWVAGSGIRWGLSAESRAEHGVPADAAHTWQMGLSRMLLGVSLTQGEGRQLFNDMLPFDAIEGVRTQILGRLLGFMDALENTMQQLAAPRSVAAWAELLPTLCHRFCLDEDKLEFASVSDQRAIQTLRTTLQKLAKSATRAACSEALPLDVLRRELDVSMAAMPPGWAFLGGGVTVAALRAYRGVPTRVVCLLGMNDGAFPRNPAIPGFDLLSKHSKPGDRDMRAEDRHAFFEAILSAREILHVSYAGRSIRDNAPLPPSMLVAELRDAIDGTVITEGKKASDALTIEHRLQPFSPRYFDGSNPHLYSYAATYAAASVASQQAKQEAQPFVTTVLPEPPPELLIISPQQFVYFFRNPAQHLLRNRLGIHLEESEGLLETVEPFVPDGLSRYQLRTSLVEDLLAGVADKVNAKHHALALARARGTLPHGAAGQVWFGQLWDEFAPFAERVAALGGSALPPCRIDLSSGDIRVHGSIGGLQQCGDAVVHMDWRVGDIRAADKLSLWLTHILLHAAGQPCTSVLLTPKEEWRLPPLLHIDHQIETLFAIYRRGCSELLPFFPATSLAWLECQRSGRERNWRKDWNPAEYGQRAESTDPYIYQAFDGCDPFDERFEHIAAHVYAAMLEHADPEVTE